MAGGGEERGKDLRQRRNEHVLLFLDIFKESRHKEDDYRIWMN